LVGSPGWGDLAPVGMGIAFGHGSPVLLIALMAGVLLDVALVVLLRQVAGHMVLVTGRGRALLGLGRTAGALVAAAGRRHRGNVLGHGNLHSDGDPPSTPREGGGSRRFL